MKPMFFALLLTFLIAPEAFASHAYLSEDCQLSESRTIHRHLRSNDGFIQTPENENGTIAEVAYENLVEDGVAIPPTGGNLFLKILNTTNAKFSAYDDGCFKGKTGTYQREVEVMAADELAKVRAGVAVSDVLKLSCTYTELYPSEKHCM